MSSKDVLGYLGIGGIFMFLFYKTRNDSSSSSTTNPIPNSSDSYQAPHEDPPSSTSWWRSSWEFIKQSFEEDLDFWSI